MEAGAVAPKPVSQYDMAHLVSPSNLARIRLQFSNMLRKTIPLLITALKVVRALLR